ncbi:MAG: hypothetical protein ACKO01_03125 [Erythrobacter sp.]
MSNVAALIVTISLVPLAFLAIYRLAGKLYAPGSFVHFLMVCVFAPFFMLFASLVATSPGRQTADQIELVDAGLVPDPGPASLPLWAETFGLPLLLYLILAPILFFLLKRRAP